MHCFAQCPVHEVLAAAGLGMEDLFPPKEIQHGRPERRPFPAADILRCLAFEALVVAAAGAAMLAGGPIVGADRERLMLAVARIRGGLDAGGLAHG